MITIIVTSLSIYLFLSFLLFAFQRQIIYFPRPEVDVPGVASTVLVSGKERIKIWTLNRGKERALLYFGGNAENVAYNIDVFRGLFPEYTLYLVNYRGYGGSSGSPNEKGLYSDALLAYDHFAKEHASLSVMGRSIGSAVATYLASKRHVDKLILITPFDSAVSIGKKRYGIFPIDLILQERLDSAGRADEIVAETLIIATEDDEIIPYENTLKLAKAFTKARLQLKSLSEVGHNTIHLHPDYEQDIIEFMR